MGEHRAGHRRGQPHGNHPLHKFAPRQASRFDISDLVTEVTLVHSIDSKVVLNAKKRVLAMQRRRTAQKWISRRSVSKQNPGQFRKKERIDCRTSQTQHAIAAQHPGKWNYATN
ncbi:hypothetical protein ACQR16_07315 [Bradyrhizobium oligotrophicum]|uniref:hypothetical protein n=1 Tax=Bradyrhizobium oligotrophicum TaxID=44255 RepID=UPI003EBCDA6A